MDPYHIEARVSKIGSRWRIKGNLKGAKSDVLDLLKTLEKSDGVERIGGVLGMRISNSPFVSTDRILEILNGCTDSSLGLPNIIIEKSQKFKQKISTEIAAIESGERESNARLAAAIDSLTPSVDYNSYSANLSAGPLYYNHFLHDGHHVNFPPFATASWIGPSQ